MTEPVDLLTRRRTVRIEAAQIAGSLLLVAAAMLFWTSATDLRSPAVGWSDWATPMTLASVLSVAAAVGPLVWSRFTVRAQRALSWSAFALASIVALAAVTVIDLAAALGCQALLCGLALFELASHPRALRWLIGTLAAALLVVGVYYAIVDPRVIVD
jgi:hypothetical protein